MGTFAIFLLLFMFSGSTHAVYKRWLPNANFGNPWNWDAGRKPCGNDKLLIHEESPSIYVQVNTTIQQLILPNDGEIVLGSNVILAFTNEPDHSADCLPSSGSQIEFNLTYAHEWLDPQNWCTADTETGQCKTVDQLDSEKVPCATDNVVFQKGSSYFVNLESGLELTVNTLKIIDTAYTTNTFASFLNTSEGHMMFPAPRTGAQSLLHILRRRCTDPTGCLCGNDKAIILKKVCQYQTPHCPRVKCSKPIRPSGSCCEICGAVLRVIYGIGFKFANIRDGLKRSVLDRKVEFVEVIYIVSKLINSTIQIVLSDNTGTQSIAAAKLMKEELDNDAGGLKYAVRTVKLEVSEGAGGAPSSGAQKSNMDKLPVGEITGIVIALTVVLIVCLVLAVFIYRRKTRGSDEMRFKLFDKFSLRSNTRKPRMEVPPSLAFRFGGSSVTAENIGASSQGFDNPMYGNNPLENEKPLDLEMVPTTNISGSMEIPPPEDLEQQVSYENGLGFDNPLYDSVNVQESFFTDASQVDVDENKDQILHEEK